MSVYAIAQGRITDPEGFQQYLALSGATLTAHDVDLLAVDETPDVIEGDIDLARTVLLKFRDREHFHTWYESPEYRKAREHRIPASVGRFLLIDGL